MKITIALPDNIAEKVCRLPDRDDFVARAVEAALAREQQQEESPSETRPSRWAKLVDQIERQPATLDGYREDLARDRRDFRRSFSFPHDES